MAGNARDLAHLHHLLVPALGEEATDNLMEYLPPVRFADLATKDDLRALEVSLRGEFGELRGEFAALRGELRGDMAAMEQRLENRLVKWVAGIALGGMTASAGIAAAVASAIAG